MSGDKRFVYVLRNDEHASDFYVGLTSDVRARLRDHPLTFGIGDVPTALGDDTVNRRQGTCSRRFRRSSDAKRAVLQAFDWKVTPLRESDVQLDPERDRNR